MVHRGNKFQHDSGKRRKPPARPLCPLNKPTSDTNTTLVQSKGIRVFFCAVAACLFSIPAGVDGGTDTRSYIRPSVEPNTRWVENAFQNRNRYLGWLEEREQERALREREFRREHELCVKRCDRWPVGLSNICRMRCRAIWGALIKVDHARIAGLRGSIEIAVTRWLDISAKRLAADMAARSSTDRVGP